MSASRPRATPVSRSEWRLALPLCAVPLRSTPPPVCLSEFSYRGLPDPVRLAGPSGGDSQRARSAWHSSQLRNWHASRQLPSRRWGTQWWVPGTPPDTSRNLSPDPLHLERDAGVTHVPACLKGHAGRCSSSAMLRHRHVVAPGARPFIQRRPLGSLLHRALAQILQGALPRNLPSNASACTPSRGQP